MYRAVGVLAAERGLALDDDAALGRLVGALSFELRDRRHGARGRRARRVGGDPARRRGRAGLSRVDASRGARALVALQRALGEAGGVVMEGRDIGTVVFPDAPVKLYLTAAPAERARRRAAEPPRGVEVDEAAGGRPEARDRRDSGREHAPLRPASDARLIDTTHLGLDEVVERMAEAVQSAVRPCKP
jgi:cytidylate kinase